LLRLGTLHLRHGDTLRSLAFSPDGRLLASGGWHRAVRLWDPGTGKELRQLVSPDKGVECLAFAPDGKTVAGGGLESTVFLWDAGTGKMVRQLTGHKGKINAVIFSPAGDLLASAGEDGTIRLWEPDTGKELRHIAGGPGAVRSLSFSGDGHTLAAANADKTASLWDPGTGKERQRFRGHEGEVWCVAVAPDGKTVASGGDDGLRLWDAGTGKQLRVLGEGGVTYVKALAFAPDGKTLAGGSQDNLIRLWDPVTGKELRQFRGHADHVSTFAFAPDGKTLASGSAESAIHLWDPATGKQLLPGRGHGERLTAVAVAPDGRLIATGAWDGAVRLWEAETGKELALWQTPAGAPPRGAFDTGSGRIKQVRFAPDGKRLVVVREDEAVLLWDVAAKKEGGKWRGQCAAFSPDGKLLAVGGRGTTVADANRGVIRLYDLGTGKELGELRGHATPVVDLLFSPDGRTLASGGQVLFGARFGGEDPVQEEHLVRVWDVDTRRQRRALGGQRGNLAAFSPDGRTLALRGFLEQTVSLWEVASGEERGRLEGHKEMVFSAAFAPDGKGLATASMDGTVRVWRLPDGKEIERLEGHRGWVLTVAYAPDGRRLVSGSIDTTALVWDISHLSKKNPAVAITAPELDALWEKLAGSARDGYQAMARLAAVPGPAVDFLRRRLEPARPADARVVARLLGELDSNEFAVRRRAAEELEKLADLAEPALRKALADNPSPEVRKHLEKLLDGVEKEYLSAEQLRLVRGLEVVELAGTPEAGELLAVLARGAPEARLTRWAKGAMERRQHAEPRR
jgi:WD40 repeat protein